MADKVEYDSESYAAISEAYFMMAEVLGILVQERQEKIDGGQELIEQLMDIIIGIRQDAASV